MKRVRYKTDQKNPQVQAYKNAVAKGLNNQHVVPRENGWAVKKAGASKVTRVFNTQEEAIQSAISIAKSQGTSVFIHGENGRIRDRKEY